jgi:hypothetical protein
MDLGSAPSQVVEPESPDFAGGEEFFGARIGAGLIDMAVLQMPQLAR